MDISRVPESVNNGSDTCNTNEKMYLQELPTDVLFDIFKFCDLSTLFAISCCCKRFYNLINEDCVWTRRSKTVLITNQASDVVIKRSARRLSAKQKCRISMNWKMGSYNEKCFFTKVKSASVQLRTRSHGFNQYLRGVRYLAKTTTAARTTSTLDIFQPNGKVRFMPKLLLEKYRLWISRGKNIYILKRSGNNVQGIRNSLLELTNAHEDDICNFVKLDSLVISADVKGRICGWSERTGELLFKRDYYERVVRSLDASDELVVYGTRDSLIKVWHRKVQGLSGNLISVYDVGDPVWSVAMDPTFTYVCCGTNGTNEDAVKMINLERETCTPFSMRRRGCAVFDIKWETVHTFLTCGYDSIIKLWDARTGKCESSWMDPFDASGYCLASDKCYSMLCGTASNGRVQLWDRRMKLSIQSYFCESSQSSPVYSVTFDPCFMFAALDMSLNILGFSGNLKHKHDYRSTWGA